MSTRVKICGITRPEDGLAAARSGADAIGLVFYARSPRAVSVQQAQAVIAALPPFVTTVGLFVDETPQRVREVLAQVPLDLLQFHGDECPCDCEGMGRPYIKVIRMRPGVDLHAFAATYPGASGLLLDSYVSGLPGGTGTAFDWSLIPDDLGKPWILAGGLTPDNVAQAVAAARPWAVDVSGGVEVSKGIKDPALIEQFLRRVRDVQ